MIDKNTEVVGVSEALRNLALTKQSQIHVDENDASDNKITINPSNEVKCNENEKIVNESSRCGFWNFTPDFIQPFMKVQWCLVFLCLAGAVQGDVLWIFYERKFIICKGRDFRKVRFIHVILGK